MAQFDVYKNRHLMTSSRYPLLLDVQADFLGALDSTLVVPLAAARAHGPRPMAFLQPQLAIDGRFYTMMTTQLCAIERRQLGPKEGDAAGSRREIDLALSMVLRGA